MEETRLFFESGKKGRQSSSFTITRNLCIFGLPVDHGKQHKEKNRQTSQRPNNGQQQYCVVLFRIGWVGSIGAFLWRASRAVHGSVHWCMAWCLVFGGLALFVWGTCTCDVINGWLHTEAPYKVCFVTILKSLENKTTITSSMSLTYLLRLVL